MSMNAQNEIDVILQPLYAPASNPEEYDDRNSEGIDQLTDLSSSYNNELASYAKQLVRTLQENEQHEFILTIVLRALQKRNQTDDLVEIASSALFNEFAEDKLFYVEQLTAVDDDRVPSLLIKALGELKSYDEYSGHAQEEIIEFLQKKHEINAAPAIIQSLTDISARVRTSALLFIRI